MLSRCSHFRVSDMGSGDVCQELGVAFGTTDKREAEMLEKERAKAQIALKVCPLVARQVPGPPLAGMGGVWWGSVVLTGVFLA